ncbi:MAG: PadR family transcriptional regulator [Candidatus Thorarchaeota archaeon]
MSEVNPEKRFVRSFLDVTILSMLLEKSLWGYRMMTLLKEKYNVKVGPPVIYPLLDSMEKNGLITSWETKQSNRVRKMYDITDEGKEYMKKFSEFLTKLVKY